MLDEEKEEREGEAAGETVTDIQGIEEMAEPKAEQKTEEEETSISSSESTRIPSEKKGPKGGYRDFNIEGGSPDRLKQPEIYINYQIV